MREKAIVKRLKIKELFLLGTMATFFLLPSAVVWADDEPAVSEKEGTVAPKTELDKLKGEWEAVREQQIQMIREKEDQLEKLKEEIFAKMKALNAPTVPQAAAVKPEVSEVTRPILPVGKEALTVSDNRSEFEVQKAALQAERQKFFKEMSRQKESLRQLQVSLDEKAKQLKAERERFEQAKKSVAR